MSIDKETVKYIAQLARIELGEDELDYHSSQLAKILSYIEKINELNLEDIPAELAPHTEANIYQEDEVRRFENIKGLLNIVPVVEDNFIKIPKVID